MSTETRIAEWLASQQPAMIALLREMVDLDSGTYNKLGIDAVGAVVERFFADHGIPVERLPQSRYGDCLRAAVPWDGPGAGGGAQGANAGGNIVLMGHRDTVFPDGEVLRRPFTITCRRRPPDCVCAAFSTPQPVNSMPATPPAVLMLDCFPLVMFTSPNHLPRYRPQPNPCAT